MVDKVKAKGKEALGTSEVIFEVLNIFATLVSAVISIIFAWNILENYNYAAYAIVGVGCIQIASVAYKLFRLQKA